MAATRLRKFLLTAHIVSSVGWIGALAAFLVPAVEGLGAQDGGTVRAAYVAMDLIAKYAIVPLAVASLVGGIIQTFITPWGLVRHYWVLFKLLIALAATFTLVNEVGRISYIATAAAESSALPESLRGLRLSILAHSIGGLAVLLWAAALAVYKPRGLTRYGFRAAMENLRR